MKIAVIGSGISGLAAAWLLARAHEVTVFEAEARPGGHSNTLIAPTPKGPVAVDTGFIVFNDFTYPNFTALLKRLQVKTEATDMSFAASLDGGDYEYAGGRGLSGFFGQPENILRPRHWRLLTGIIAFVTRAARDADRLPETVSLGAYLQQAGFSQIFIRDHILPMGAAIWSTPAEKMLDYPARAFIRFFANHGLLRLSGHARWRTVTGGSREYVRRLIADGGFAMRLSSPVTRVAPTSDGRVSVNTAAGSEMFDEVVIATHSDQALAMRAEPSAAERALLGAVRYIPNRAVLHSDPALMPKRRRVWAAWNYLAAASSAQPAGAEPGLPTVTYWMNRLQNLDCGRELFVTLNPPEDLPISNIIADLNYAHPAFDAAALSAQRVFWHEQGRNRIWYCGAWLGAGFHEDGLQAGLAVAEAIGGVRRPWTVKNESSRISLHHLPQRPAPTPLTEDAA